MSQSIRLLYCYLGKKWTTLEIIEGGDPDGFSDLYRAYQCLGADDICRKRRCRLSDSDLCSADEVLDPWFDE